MQGKAHLVEMQAEATGIHRDGPAAKPEYFLFNIGGVTVMSFAA